MVRDSWGQQFATWFPFTSSYDLPPTVCRDGLWKVISKQTQTSRIFMNSWASPNDFTDFRINSTADFPPSQDSFPPIPHGGILPLKDLFPIRSPPPATQSHPLNYITHCRIPTAGFPHCRISCSLQGPLHCKVPHTIEYFHYRIYFTAGSHPLQDFILTTRSFPL